MHAASDALNNVAHLVNRNTRSPLINDSINGNELLDSSQWRISGTEKLWMVRFKLGHSEQEYYSDYEYNSDRENGVPKIACKLKDEPKSQGSQDCSDFVRNIVKAEVRCMVKSSLREEF